MVLVLHILEEYNTVVAFVGHLVFRKRRRRLGCEHLHTLDRLTQKQGKEKTFMLPKYTLP